MAWLRWLALTLSLPALLATPLQAQVGRFPPPRLRATAEKPVEVRGLDVQVRINGLWARTTQTVVFYNPNNRVLEGDLEFPLPDGATVSGFALDVGGRMVDGVVVQKDAARVALETEVRAGVDPGLVEQVRGNLYRARVYPIPAQGTRTVRLSWVSPLVTRGQEAAYHLPLAPDRVAGKVGLRVEVARAASAPLVTGGFGNVALKQWENLWVAEASWQSGAPKGDLLVRLPQLPDRLVALEPAEGDTALFAVSDTLPLERTARPAPRRIAVAWDASGSRTADATARELAFLQQLLAAWPQTVVDLVVFRDRAEPVVSLSGPDAAQRLITHLKSQPCDGATALDGLDLRRAARPHADDALWLIFSDGLATWSEGLPARDTVPVWTVTAATTADRNVLRELSSLAGGRLVDLPALGDGAVPMLLQPAPSVASVEAHPAGAVDGLVLLPHADPGRFVVAGRLKAGSAELRVRVGDQTRVVPLVRKEAVASAAAGGAPGPVALAWAQGRVAQLAVFADRHADELLALGRRFGLVTPGTSLLVLETVEQYVRHDIEPPASLPAMVAAFREQKKLAAGRRQKDDAAHMANVVQLWSARVAWWEKMHTLPPGWKLPQQESDEAMPAGVGGSASGMGFTGVGRGGGGSSAPRMMAPPPDARAAVMAMDAAPSERSESAPRMYRAMAAAPSSAAPERAMAKSTAPSTEASITVAKWNPAAPYMAPLRSAPAGQAYAAYLAQRDQHASPAFFLDCADHLLQAGEKPLGLRVLSNLAELRLDAPELLRVLAWRLTQAGQWDAAVTVLEKVRRLRPEEPHARRDLALALAERGEALRQAADLDRAVSLLREVVEKPWERFPEIELVALMELNRIVARAGHLGLTLKPASLLGLDKRLLRNLDLDLRVSLGWDADLTDVDLHLFEPTDEHAYYAHNRTQQGGLVSRDFVAGYGPEEYLLRKALPGGYAIKAHYFGSRTQSVLGPATLVATVFTNWGRPDEKRQTLTLRLQTPRDLDAIGEVRIGPAGKEPVATVQPPGPGAVRLERLPASALTRGMTQDEVRAVLGAPLAESAGEWRYAVENDLVRVRFDSAGRLASVVRVSREAEVELLD